MKNNIYISIIVPVYNKENNIDKLIQNITLSNKDTEIILVDDCSSDSSVEKIEKHQSPYVKLIKLHKNSGVHIARNIGIKEATGVWIVCLDADDYINTNGSVIINQTLKEHESQYDAIFFSYITNQGKTTGFIKGGVYTSEEYISRTFSNHKYIFRDEPDALYCIKRDLIEKYKIKWEFTNLDYIFRNRVALYSKKILFIDNQIATYVKNNINSLTKQRKNIKYKLDISNIKVNHHLIFLNEFSQFFSNHRGTLRYIKILYADFKYSKNRILMLPKILKTINNLNSKEYLRFIIISLIPIRTLALIKYKFLSK